MGKKYETTKTCKQGKLKSTEQTKMRVTQFTPNFSKGIKGNTVKDPFDGVITLVSFNTPLFFCES